MNLRASLTATNLFVITEYDGLDPEIGNGIENNFYPRTRDVVLGKHILGCLRIIFDVVFLPWPQVTHSLFC